MMEHSTTTTNSSNTNNNQTTHQHNYLKQLNKTSHHKISKPIRKPPPFNHQQLLHKQEQEQEQEQVQGQGQYQNYQQHPQSQPPVYNINKNDFRNVVQRLTGSTAHFTTPLKQQQQPPPPMHLPKPQISRLQRIRPPPLPLNNAIPIQSISANSGHQSTSLFSPLPPFPTVHAAADSPISAYMKYLRESTPSSMGLTSQSVIPSSPLGFGLVSSPRSPYPLISPKSPTAASLEFFQ